MSSCGAQRMGYSQKQMKHYPGKHYPQKQMMAHGYEYGNMPEITCLCDMSGCVCDVGTALIGPSPMAADGTIDLNWIYEGPSNELPRVISEFGTPRILDTNPGGMAIWTKEQLVGTPYTEIVLKDEEIPHESPIFHYDYLTAGICVDLTPEIQAAMLPITKSVWYDRLTKTLYARCHYQSANVATLLLVTRMALSLVNPKDAPGLYGDLLMAAKEQLTYEAMVGELAHNVNALGC